MNQRTLLGVEQKSSGCEKRFGLTQAENVSGDHRIVLRPRAQEFEKCDAPHCGHPLLANPVQTAVASKGIRGTDKQRTQAFRERPLRHSPSRNSQNFSHARGSLCRGQQLKDKERPLTLPHASIHGLGGVRFAIRGRKR